MIPAGKSSSSITQLLRSAQQMTSDWLRSHQMSDIQSFLSKRDIADISSDIEAVGFQAQAHSQERISKPAAKPKSSLLINQESMDY